MLAADNRSRSLSASNNAGTAATASDGSVGGANWAINASRSNGWFSLASSIYVDKRDRIANAARLTRWMGEYSMVWSLPATYAAGAGRNTARSSARRSSCPGRSPTGRGGATFASNVSWKGRSRDGPASLGQDVDFIVYPKLSDPGPARPCIDWHGQPHRRQIRLGDAIPEQNICQMPIMLVRGPDQAIQIRKRLMDCCRPKHRLSVAGSVGIDHGLPRLTDQSEIWLKERPQSQIAIDDQFCVTNAFQVFFEDTARQGLGGMFRKIVSKAAAS